MKKFKWNGMIISVLLIVASLIGCQEDFLMSDLEKALKNNDSISITLKGDTIKVKTSPTDTTKTTTPTTPTTTPVVTPTPTPTPAPTPGVEQANYYVSPSGDDNNPGTSDKPFKSIQKAYNVASAGNLIYVRGGTYYPTSMLNFTGRNGSSGNLIKIWAYPNEKPVIDLSKVAPDHGIYIGASYIHLKGFEVTNYKQPSNGQYIATIFIENGTNNIVELCNIHHNGGAGIYLEKGANNNTILNCDAHHNYDPYTSGYVGGNSDGMHMCTYANTTNYIKGCRLYNNSDDGLDCFCAAGTIIVTDTWCFRNGYLDGTSNPVGDGNGFKLGGDNDAGNTGYARQLKNCLSFENLTRAYNDNDSHDKFKIEYSIAYNNGAEGFNLNNSTFNHVLSGNTSFGNKYSNADLNSQTSQTHNNWNDGITPTSSDFNSTSSSVVLNARQSDGSLPAIDYLKIKSTSKLYQYCVDPSRK